MAALNTFAELMARASATVFSQLCTNALEKANQQQQHPHQQSLQQQQQQAAAAAAAAFSMLPPLLAIPLPASAQQQLVPLPSAITPIVVGACTPQFPQAQIRSSPPQQQKLFSGGEPQQSTNPTTVIATKTKQKHHAEQQRNGGATSRKRKKPSAAATAEALVPSNADDIVVVADDQHIAAAAMESQKQETSPQSLAVPSAECQPSISPLSTSRISSPDSACAVIGGGGHKARKLKLYAAEEKTDIIDYAKCIGNRAAGREFNVAESSIREWRKNEEKIRKQAENTAGCTQYFEKQQPDILAEIDEALVRMLKAKEKRCSSWYGIAERANTLWREKAEAKDSKWDGSEMKITMGWIARFMRRNEQRVPKIAPPIIATGGNSGAAANAAIGLRASGTSPGIARRSTLIGSTKRSSPTVETRAKARSRAKTNSSNNGNQKEQQRQGDAAANDEGKGAVAADGGVEGDVHANGASSSSCSRRKRFKPMRVDANCATLLITTNTANDKTPPTAPSTIGEKC